MLRVGRVSVVVRWFVQFFGLTELKGAIRDFQGPVVMLSTVTLDPRECHSTDPFQQGFDDQEHLKKDAR